jgi:hypothetical protein
MLIRFHLDCMERPGGVAVRDVRTTEVIKVRYVPHDHNFTFRVSSSRPVSASCLAAPFKRMSGQAAGRIAAQGSPRLRRERGQEQRG